MSVDTFTAGLLVSSSVGTYSWAWPFLITMVILNHTPIIALSWISDDVILFGMMTYVCIFTVLTATGNKLFTHDTRNDIIRLHSAFPSNTTVFRILCDLSSVRCSCLRMQHLDTSLELESNFATVFGNKLCVILSISKDTNLKTLFSLATTEFVCGACVRKLVKHPIFSVMLCSMTNTFFSLFLSMGSRKFTVFLHQIFCPRIFCRTFV